MEPLQMQESRLIMITGCTKGVGFGILQNLAITQPNYNFLMVVKSIERGEKVVEDLKKVFPNIKERVTIHELDIANSKSIDALINWIKEKDLKIDCLVNNASVMAQTNRINSRVTKEAFQVNFYGSVELTEKLFPLLPANSKIVNITTELGMFGTLHSPDFQKQLENSKSPADLINVAKEFEDKVAAKRPPKGDHPFPTSPYPIYCFSKLLMNVYTQILANNPEVKKKGIQVYSCSPSWVKEYIGDPMSEWSYQQGVICPCNIINLPFKLNESLQGKFFSNSEVTPL